MAETVEDQFFLWCISKSSLLVKMHEVMNQSDGQR
jgi:hypothetical protein